MEKPHTSRAAKAVSFISFIFVVVSTVGMTLNTMPAFRHSNPVSLVTEDNPRLAMVEAVCIFWFTLEYLLRFSGAPKKISFLVDGMNIVDLLAILPFYIELIEYPVNLSPTAHEESPQVIIIIIIIILIIIIITVIIITIITTIIFLPTTGIPSPIPGQP